MSGATGAAQSVRGARRLRGTIEVPGDKSISHRAVIFNSIAAGSALITNFLPGEDCLSSIACMRSLGVPISLSLADRTVQVEGRGLHGLSESADLLDAGNSGTTMRLLSGLLSGFPFLSILSGDASLRSRPMKRVIEPLKAMGAAIWGRQGDSLAPLVIRGGSLTGFDYALPVASAQLKSCLLLAALYADGPTTLTGLIESRDHTERMLGAMGAPLEVSTESLRISGPARTLQPLDMPVPGDLSSAAFWLVAGSAHPDAHLLLLNVGVNPTRIGLIDVLREMGADILFKNERTVAGEPVADLEVKSASLRGTNVGGSLIPRLVDEIPALTVAALTARGQTAVRDAAELRVKETDRIATIAAEFSRLGAQIETRPDGLLIQGEARLEGSTVNSHGDHRLAMSLALAGLLLPSGQAVQIENPHCADVSYPDFWADLERVSL